MTLSDLVVARGTVRSDPMFPRNGSVTVCVFELSILEGESTIPLVARIVTSVPGLVEKCRYIIEKGNRVTVVGKAMAAPVPKIRLEEVTLEKG